MAALQGLRRINDGITKRLTKSEADRGYIFITNDRQAKKMLGKKIKVQICGSKLLIKTIDSSGRITVGRAITDRLNNRIFTIRFIEGNLIIE